MKRDSHIIFHALLVIGDAFAVTLSFLVAYLVRTHLDQRPFYFESAPLAFAASIIWLVPIYLIILASLGLYKKAVFLDKTRWSETWRLFLVSVIGMMVIISYDFFLDADLFPVRIMALYAVISSFIFLVLFRIVVRAIRHKTMSDRRTTLRAVVIGSNKNTEFLTNYISAFPESGFVLAGIVAPKKFIPADLRKKQYSSLKEALKKSRPDVIFQTDERHTEYVYRESVNRHLLYYFVPSAAQLSSQMGDLELIGDLPAILVPVTPLSGSARILKRLTDLILGSFALILAALPMAIIWLCQKLSSPKAPALYIDTRLSRHNRRVKIYKFRSMKPEYSGMTPEEAFQKMGKPELIKKYRKNGDTLENDPRITKLGHFLRSTSLDELPQLINVIKGDISLVGPRALVPGELKHYGDRSLILSVKSGLTGLAQVSGRRDISFEERRALDIYYIQNWSLALDFSILFRTIGAVLFRKGAK